MAGEGGDGGSTQGAANLITVIHNGAEIQVEKPAGLFTQKEIDEKFHPKAAHNDQMARMRKELDALKGRRDPEELLQDQDFRTRATQHWGLDPNATAAQLQETLKRREAEIAEREVKPREAKLTKANETIAALRAKDLRGQIIQAAAAAKLEEKYLKAPTKGGKPLIVSMLEEAFAFDDQHGEWFARGSNGNPFLFSQSGEMPYQTVAEFVTSWAAADGKEFVRSERQAGAGAGQDRKDQVPGQVGRELRLTAEQIRDIPFYRQMQAKAEKEGLTIVPV